MSKTIPLSVLLNGRNTSLSIIGVNPRWDRCIQMGLDYFPVGFDHSEVTSESCEERINYRIPPFHGPYMRVSFMENVRFNLHFSTDELKGMWSIWYITWILTLCYLISSKLLWKSDYEYICILQMKLNTVKVYISFLKPQHNFMLFHINGQDIGKYIHSGENITHSLFKVISTLTGI
jgi:hypothetical protein